MSNPDSAIDGRRRRRAPRGGRGRARFDAVAAILVASAVVVPAVVAAEDRPTDPEPPPTAEQETPPAPVAGDVADGTPDPGPGGDQPADPPPVGDDGTPRSGEPETDEAPVPEVPPTAPEPTAPEPTPDVEAPPGPVGPVGLDIRILPSRIQHVLATIRYLESRNTYDLPPNLSGASGAYQFIESTWGGFGGYQHAYLAPPAVQDERAVEDVLRFLDRYDGDVSMVPVLWYFPRAVREPELMDVVPKPQYGNKLTIREYQTRWLEVFAELSGEELPPILTADELARRDGSPPLVPDAGARGVLLDDDGEVVAADANAAGDDETDGPPAVSLAFPVLGPSRLASLDCANEVLDAARAELCAEHAPGVVFGVKLQPVLAAADGIVTSVDDRPGSGRPISVVVTSVDGISIEYRGFNDDSPGTDDGAAPDHLRLSPLARVGAEVRAGQILGFMGDSDPLSPSIRSDVPTDATERLDPDATAPHIRLTITDERGRPVDVVGPLLDARARESCRVGIGGWSMPPLDSPVDPVVVETTDLHPGIDSEWVITWTGQVVASGWAAMINPVALCGWVPEDGFGPGAAGSRVGRFEWLRPLELPTEMWVDLALRDETTPDAFVLPG